MSEQGTPNPPGGDLPPPASPEPAPTDSPPTVGAPRQLEPGRGAPLVPGPPKSVSDPISAGKVNTVFGMGGLLGILVIIVVVILIGLVLVTALSRH